MELLLEPFSTWLLFLANFQFLPALDTASFFKKKNFLIIGSALSCLYTEKYISKLYR